MFGGESMATLGDDNLMIVRAQPLFSGLDSAILDLLLNGATVRTFLKGRLIFQRGDPASKFFVILDGWVKVYRDTSGGEHAVLGVFNNGDMFAEAAAFLGGGYPANAEAIEDATLIALDSKNFASVVSKEPDVALNMLASMSRHLHRLVHEVETLKTRSAGQRLVEFLLRRCRGVEGEAIVDLPYDKHLIAARLGVQPESLSRLFNKLRDHGVESDAHKVYIKDVAALREYYPYEDDLEERTVA